MNKAVRILVPLAVVAVVAGCAKEQTLSTGQKAKEYLELFVSKNYPQAQANQWGMYILEDVEGTGDAWSSDMAYSYLSGTIRSIDGTIVSSTEADIAKQLDQDSYKDYNYYGPKYQNTSSGSGYAGLEYMLQGMKIGGKRTAILPSWLLTSSRFNTLQEYLNDCSSSTHLIYSITLEGQCADVSAQEIAILRQYVTDHYGADQKSCSFTSDQTEGTFYFVSDTTDTAIFNDEKKRADDAVLYLTYEGRRLDGTAFDTNDKYIALETGLFDPAKTYAKSKITFSSTYSSITMDSSSSLIDGFKAGLHKMHWSGQTATVLFVSAYGYSSSGSGDVIPPYSPLVFTLTLSDE